MKRLSVLSFVILAVLVLFSGMAHAVGTCVLTNLTSTQLAAESPRIPDAETVIVTLACVGDSTAGTFPAVIIPVTGSYPSSLLNTYNLTGFFLYEVGRTPGTPAPTASYTVTVTDAKGFALDLALLTTNGSATAAQLTPIVFTSTTTAYPVVRSALTVQISATTVDSAVITLDLIFRTRL